MVQKGSSNLQFVKRIPSDVLRALVGRKLIVPLGDELVELMVTSSTQSIRFSLRTSDPVLVKVRQAEAIGYLEQFFEALRSKREIELSHRQIHALAGEFYRAWSQGPDGITSLTVTPSNGEVIRGPWADDEEAELLAAAGQRLAEKAEEGGAEYLHKTYGPLVDRMLAERGIPRVTPGSRERLVRAFSSNLTKGLAASSRIASGDYSADPILEKLPKWEPPIVEMKDKKAASALSFDEMLEGWWAEAKATGRSESTCDSYSTSFKHLANFLGHSDATKVTPKDIVDFKDHRLSAIHPKTGKAVSAKTVKAIDLVALKSVFGWAVSNLKLLANPASAVTVKSSKKVKLRERDFTEPEIKALLQAAAAVDVSSTPQHSWKTRLAKRWVPYLCAYSGARVGEIVQLRKQDFREEGGALIMQVNPEAGTVKTKDYRDVPIHPHLIELGFAVFLRDMPSSGYLFMDVKPGSTVRGVWRSKKNRLADFAREYVKDPNVAPNHGWRHTFKSRGFEAGIQEKVLDAICGHSAANVARQYGSVTLKTKVDAIAQFPRYLTDSEP